MPTLVVKHEAMINPETLDDQTKEELWEGLKKMDPALARMLARDPDLSELKNSFAATIRFTRVKAREYVRAGRKVLEEKQNVKSNQQVLQDQ